MRARTPANAAIRTSNVPAQKTLRIRRGPGVGAGVGAGVGCCCSCSCSCSCSCRPPWRSSRTDATATAIASHCRWARAGPVMRVSCQLKPPPLAWRNPRSTHARRPYHAASACRGGRWVTRCGERTGQLGGPCRQCPRPAHGAPPRRGTSLSNRPSSGTAPVPAIGTRVKNLHTQGGRAGVGAHPLLQPAIRSPKSAIQKPQQPSPGVPGEGEVHS